MGQVNGGPQLGSTTEYKGEPEHVNTPSTVKIKGKCIINAR